MQPDAKAQSPLRRNPGSAILEHALHLDAAAHRVERGREFGEQVVAHGVDDAAAMSGHALRDLFPRLGERAHRRRLVLCEQTCVALAFRGEDRGEAMLKLRPGHGRILLAQHGARVRQDRGHAELAREPRARLEVRLRAPPVPGRET
jgi:hypothetical protein